MYTALTIAGSDSSGGAGIQADIKTMTANGVYAMSAITALTAQNTTGVTSIMEATPQFLAEELDCIFTDIYPDAIKTGMVSSSELIEVIADKLTGYQAKNIVVDPVMVATSGARLISEDAISTLKSKLLPLAKVITPNIPEAEVLSEMQIKSEADMENILSRTDIAVASDGYNYSYDRSITVDTPHPRNFSTFPHALELAREKNLMPMEDIVYKMPGLPASMMGMNERGILAVGKVADVTIFDWARVGQAGDYQNSVQRPHGIEYVIVSGEKVLDHGKLTGEKPGTILRHNQC